MSYTYATFQTALALEMVIPNNNVNDPNFQLILPTIIDYAEQRCYRELDIVRATTSQTITMTAGNFNIDTSALNPAILIAEDFNVITPASVTDPDLGTRNYLTPVSKEWLFSVFNSADSADVPRYFAVNTDQTFYVGPWPDQAYTVECIGKYRPTPLYATPPMDGTQTTFLTSILPDLFLAAAMISAMGYRHNFGAMTDEPRSAVSWENQYQTLLHSAKGEETRKAFRGYQQTTSESTPMQNA